MDVLYAEGEADNFLLCKQLSAETKKLQAIRKSVDHKLMDNIPGMVAAANSFEARATRVVSELYGRRRDSLKSALDQADKKLSDMVYFGEAK